MLKMLASESVNHGGTLGAVDRAIIELRRGHSLEIVGQDGGRALILSAEHADGAALDDLRHPAGAGPFLLLTTRRAQALGIADNPDGEEAAGIVRLTLDRTPAARIRDLADPVSTASRPVEEQILDGDPGLDAAAIELAKLAHLLPAVVIVPISGDKAVGSGRSSTVGADAIGRYLADSALELEPVSEARVPLFGAEDTRIIAFRPRDGGLEHLAIVIGEPDPLVPVLTRIHSECFTGDLLGSLRCDCGDQLRGAIRTIAASGSGVLVYLAQEGRGIGLANKLRAYQLQDGGADTVEANEQLGFDPDERLFLPAVAILRHLGFARVRLLTNNQAKVAALEHCGIAVVERVPHSFPSNRHNEAYLNTKAQRFGHQF